MSLSCSCNSCNFTSHTTVRPYFISQCYVLGLYYLAFNLCFICLLFKPKLNVFIILFYFFFFGFLGYSLTLSFRPFFPNYFLIKQTKKKIKTYTT